MVRKNRQSMFGASPSLGAAGGICGSTLLVDDGFAFQGGARLEFRIEEMGNNGGGVKSRLGSNPLEELVVEDDYYDEQMLPEKKRRLTSEQVDLLEKSFETENKLEPVRKSELARKLGIHPRQIAIWFQNRRARWKTKQLERDYDQLKALYDTLLANHDSLRANHNSVLHDNQRLRDEVSSLTEKLQTKDLAHDPIHHLSMPPSDAILAPEPKAETEVDASTTYAISLTSIEPNLLEDHLTTESHVSCMAEDGQLGLLSESGDSYYPNLEEGSYHGGHNYVILSEEDDCGSGCYFSDVYPGGGGTMVVEYRPSEAEVGGGVGWCIWN